MSEKLIFNSWQRSNLFEGAIRHGTDTHLSSQLTLTLSDINTGQQVVGNTTFRLMAAADVAGLKPGAIKHMAPTPFARDAETTKLVHLDFWEKDLPWRYTPQMLSNNILHPWLVLLVGIGTEIQVEEGIITKLEDSLLKVHNLDDSHLWAHIQKDDHDTMIGRILSPRGMELDKQNKPVGLLPQHEYIAALVPAFNQNGEQMWSINGERVVRQFDGKEFPRVFHFWRFWTSEAGDFETLAAALHMSKAGDIGKAKLHYRRKVTNIDKTLEVRGAITSLQQSETSQEQKMAIQAVQADLEALQKEPGVDAIGLPHYGHPWLPKPDTIVKGWPYELNTDPRFRGIAGLGTWMGVEAQEALMDAAVKQAGALREAGQRISYLALGLWAAGRLWDRRLPTNKNERLHILGPMMRRMLAANGGLVLECVTSGSSPLTPALFSSTAQRLLRDRSVQTRYIRGANGGINRNEALAAANQAERQPERAPNGLPHFDTIAEEMKLEPILKLFSLEDSWINEVIEQLFKRVHDYSNEYRHQRDNLHQSGQEQEIPNLRQNFADSLSSELTNLLQDRLSERRMPCEGLAIFQTISQEFLEGIVRFFEKVLEDDSAQRYLYDALWRELRRCMAKLPCQKQINNVELPNQETFCDELIDRLPHEPGFEQKPINLDGLSDALYAALDPRKPDAPAKVRLCGRLKGIDCIHLIPPEFPIGLDFPVWDLLKKYDKEWLLPGVNGLEKDSITALQTNPAFIDAYMVGINTQFISEMRWRDLAVTRNCTPLRMFWGQINYATQKRQADIQPLAEWTKMTADPIGALSHQTIQPDDPRNKAGNRLVIAFRSDLFRRYPSTLIYLVKPPEGQPEGQLDQLLRATPQLDKPDGISEAEWRKNREYFGPIFIGTITQEIIFFIFDVIPSELDQYWLVLDEPPAERRFRNDKPHDTTNSANLNSANFAAYTLDQPTRVAISGVTLKAQGNRS